MSIKEEASKGSDIGDGFCVALLLGISQGLVSKLTLLQYSKSKLSLSPPSMTAASAKSLHNT